MLLLAASLFFAEPAPLDMPRAEAYLVRESGVRRLEDRFDVMDLWTSQTVDGRWIDTNGRVFTLATLNALVPRPDLGETTKTRSDWMAARLPIARKDVRQVLDNYRDTTPISTFSSLATGAL